MKRFTFLNGDGYPVVDNDNCFEEQSEHYCGPAIERLAAYEDTGLEPEDVRAMFSSVEKMGLPLWKLEELAKAEKDEWLMVLPCKVGDTVYIEGHKFPAEIERISVTATGVFVEWVEFDRGYEVTEVWDNGEFLISEIGKTVFLTREEAEKALKDNGEK